MNQDIIKRIPQKIFEKFIVEYTSSYPLLLSVAWVLYYHPNHNDKFEIQVIGIKVAMGLGIIV